MSVVALDNDPVLMLLGRRAYGDNGGRLSWVQADLRSPEWTGAVSAFGRFDAVVSTTALHWLERDVLRAAYAGAGAVLEYYRDWGAELPDELSTTVVLMRESPDPSIEGPVLASRGVYTGPRPDARLYGHATCNRPTRCFASLSSPPSRSRPSPTPLHPA